MFSAKIVKVGRKRKKFTYFLLRPTLNYQISTEGNAIIQFLYWLIIGIVFAG